MDLTGFIILLVISVIVSAILHYGVKFYVVPGHWSFVSKVIVGYYGAWWGTAVFGRWPGGLSYGGDIYYIPAILGAAALVIFAVDVGKMFAKGR